MLSSNLTAPADFKILFLFIGGASELLINLVGIPLSLVNLYLVARTSVIHPNMKAILIFQSFFILLRGSCRFVICLFKFILWDPIGAESMRFFPAIAKMYFIGIYSRNFVPHVLIIERVLATVFVQSYEKCRGCLFTILWMPISLTISIYIAFTSSPQVGQPLTNVITFVIEFVAGTIELIIFYQLCRFNSRVYQQMLLIDGSHSLSIQYQLSENIRIGKQLIAPLSLNLGNVFAGPIILLWDFLNLPFYEQIQSCGINLNSLFGLLIELFIITFYPFLKRDLYRILHRFGTIFARHFMPNNRRIGDCTAPTVGITRNASSFDDKAIAKWHLISEKALMDQSKMGDHFAILKEAWRRSLSNDKNPFFGLSKIYLVPLFGNGINLLV